MKATIALTLVLLMTPLATTAKIVNPDTDTSICANLYRTGWNGMDMLQQSFYVVVCTAAGWP